MNWQEIQEIGLGSPKEPLTFQTGEAARHCPEQNGDGTPTVGDFDGLTGSHPSKDGTSLPTQLADTNAFHVRHGSTSFATDRSQPTLRPQRSVAATSQAKGRGLESSRSNFPEFLGLRRMSPILYDGHTDVRTS